MPYLTYAAKAMREDTLRIVDQADEICRHYESMGYELTLRQLFYQFVARGLLPNSDKNYKRLGSIINDARLSGLIDWHHISDRTRNVRRLTTWSDPSSIIDASAEQFRRDTWSVSGQDYRVEVWVEKEALADVVARAADRWQVPYFSCRGYVSQSEMWRAGRRMKSYLEQGITPVVLHLGDHDPSGIDMSRDIAARLEIFAEEPVQVDRIALTMAQIHQFSPPPNPAKMTDSRGSDYVRRFGYQSWELDALEPQMLVGLISDHIEDLVTDRPAWDDALAEDASTRDRMRQVANRWNQVYLHWNDIEQLLDTR